MKIDAALRDRLLNEINEAQKHFIEAAQIVSSECTEEEKKRYRTASEEPAQKLQELIDELQL